MGASEKIAALAKERDQEEVLTIEQTLEVVREGRPNLPQVKAPMLASLLRRVPRTFTETQVQVLAATLESDEDMEHMERVAGEFQQDVYDACFSFATGTDLDAFAFAPEEMIDIVDLRGAVRELGVHFGTAAALTAAVYREVLEGHPASVVAHVAFQSVSEDLARRGGIHKMLNEKIQGKKVRVPYPPEFDKLSIEALEMQEDITPEALASMAFNTPYLLSNLDTRLARYAAAAPHLTGMWIVGALKNLHPPSSELVFMLHDNIDPKIWGDITAAAAKAAFTGFEKTTGEEEAEQAPTLMLPNLAPAGISGTDEEDKALGTSAVNIAAVAETMFLPQSSDLSTAASLVLYGSIVSKLGNSADMWMVLREQAAAGSEAAIPDLLASL